MLTLSVIMPVKNAMATLNATLASLAALRPAPLEILLVDNGSTDGSLLRLAAFARMMPPGRVRVLQEATPGAAAARNRGAASAQGTLLAFTDADCQPASDWIGQIAQAFTDPTTAAVAGRIAGVAATPLEAMSSLFTFRTGGAPTTYTTWTPWSGGFATANFAIRRTAFHALDGFDIGLAVAGEDYDLCARIYAAGHRIQYWPDARVTHTHRTSLAGMLRQAFRWGTAHPILLQRYTPKGLWVTLPGFQFAWNTCPVRCWVEGTGADKKLGLALLMFLLFPAAWLVLPAVTGWIAWSVFAAWRHTTEPIPLPWLPSIILLLILKSAALTGGRWWGSIRHATICI